MLLSLKGEKEGGGAQRHGPLSMQKCLWDHSAQLLSCMWLQRRGCFLRTFLPEGRAFQVGWLIWLQDEGREEREKEMEGKKKREGRERERPSTLSLYGFSASMRTHARTPAQQRAQDFVQ